MRQLQPVIWQKGTFLSPQYLQTQDRFIESVLQFRLEALNFRPWGFRELRVNQEELAGGNFAISRAVGIFPDGLTFDIPESDPAPPPKPLLSLFDAEQESVDVYLAIPQYRERGLNVSVAQRGAETRFVAEVVNIRDENSGGSEKSIQIARKNFRFLVEGESQEGSSTLRVGRINRTAAGTLTFRYKFYSSAA